MHDPTVRFALLYGIVGTTLVAGSAYAVWYLRRAYWARLRRAGNPRAKARELRRGKKR